jgi:hypothetical protein
LTDLLLRSAALVRTRFWDGKKFCGWKRLGWKPRGFTVQVTLKFLPQETVVEGVEEQTKKINASSDGERGRSIET